MLVAIVALLVGAGVTYVLAVMGSGGKVAISKGGVSIEVAADDNFISLLDKALEKDNEAVTAALASRRFYHMASDEFLSELAGIKPSDQHWKRVSDGMRRMLANLEGPFQLPGTLSQADEKLMQAFEDLEGAVSEAKEASALLATLWERNLEQRGVFRQRVFPANIRIIEHAPENQQVIFACTGGGLVGGRIIDVFTEKGSSLRGEIYIDPSYFDCAEPAVSVREMLTEKVPISLGMNIKAFKTLYPDADLLGIENNTSSSAKFVVYPRHLVAGMNAEALE